MLRACLPDLSRYTVIDLETTGLNPKQDRITEIGVLNYANGKVLFHGSLLVNPQIPIPEEVQRINGISQQLVEESGVFVVEALFWMIEHCAEDPAPIVGHNIFNFDLPFLSEAGLDFTEGVIDTALLFKGLVAGRSYDGSKTLSNYYCEISELRIWNLKYNLRHAAESLGIAISGTEFHRAKADVLVSHQILQKLLTM